MTTRLHLRSVQPAHYDQFDQVPPSYTAELVNGKLHAIPRPQARHIHSASVLGRRLGTPFEDGIGGPGGWWILDESEIHLVENQEVTVPDLAGWRRERMPVLPDDHKFRVIPDWICEILSPSTRDYDMLEKVPLYGAHDVHWLWIIDPDECWLDVFSLANRKYQRVRRFTANEPICAVPFETVSFHLFHES